jgi:DNA-binding FadR family transcriptional regulator
MAYSLPMSILRPSSPPLYAQVADAIRSEIAAGNPPAGGSLPGEKTLAKRYGVGRNTVRDAMAMLRAEGLIDGRQGHRSRVL